MAKEELFEYTSEVIYLPETPMPNERTTVVVLTDLLPTTVAI